MMVESKSPQKHSRPEGIIQDSNVNLIPALFEKSELMNRSSFFDL